MKKNRPGSRSWFILALSTTLCAAGLAELTIRLDLVPLLMLVPALGWFVIVTAVSAVVVVCMILVRRRLRFTTKSVLLLVFVLTWVAAGLNNEITFERRRASAQQASVEQLMTMKPTLISFSGRYLDGRNQRSNSQAIIPATSAHRFHRPM